jgi:hypothetical protein
MGVVAWWPEREPDAEKLRYQTKEAYDLRKKLDEYATIHRRWEERRRRAYFDRIEENFVLREDHVALLKNGYWLLQEGTDVACVAMSGKYPFGSGDYVEDVARILGWTLTYDADGIKAEWVQKAADLMAELPHALKAILAVIDPIGFVKGYHDKP